jgi:hypothetical protein
MADFNSPGYASYLELCGKLDLEHTFEDGDQFGVWRMFYDEPDWHWGAERFPEGWTDRPGGQPAVASKLHPWLPEVGDWLDLLEGEGFDEIEFVHWTGKPDLAGVRYMVRPSEDDGRPPVMAGVTREEALAKLFLAVRGKGR